MPLNQSGMLPAILRAMTGICANSKRLSIPSHNKHIAIAWARDAAARTAVSKMNA